MTSIFRRLGRKSSSEKIRSGTNRSSASVKRHASTSTKNISGIGSFEQIAALKKRLTDNVTDTIIFSLTNQVENYALTLRWSFNQGELIEDDNCSRYIAPQEQYVGATISIGQDLNLPSARVYQLSPVVKVDLSEEAIAKAKAQLDNMAKEAGTLRRREAKHELFFLSTWGLDAESKPLCTAEWAVTPAGVVPSNWSMWHAHADRLSLDFCSIGSSRVHQATLGTPGARQNVALASFILPGQPLTLVVDIKLVSENHRTTVATMQSTQRAISPRRSLFDVQFNATLQNTPPVMVTINNQLGGINMQHGVAIGLRCHCSSSDTWSSTINAGKQAQTVFSPFDGEQAAAGLVMYELDQPCGNWVHSCASIVVIWRVRGTCAQAYIIAAEQQDWKQPVLDAMLEIDIAPDVNHESENMDDYKKTTRIVLDEEDNSYMEAKFEWNEYQGLCLQVTFRYRNKLNPSTSRASELISRVTSVKYRNRRVLTRLNGTVIRTAVPRLFSMPELFTIHIVNQHAGLHMYNPQVVVLNGSSVSLPNQQLDYQQESTAVFTPAVQDGISSGFMFFKLADAQTNEAIPQDPCVLIVWQATMNAPPQLLVHSMCIPTEWAKLLNEPNVANGLYDNLKQNMTHADGIVRNVQLACGVFLSFRTQLKMSGSSTTISLWIGDQPVHEEDIGTTDEERDYVLQTDQASEQDQQATVSESVEAATTMEADAAQFAANTSAGSAPSLTDSDSPDDSAVLNHPHEEQRTAEHCSTSALNLAPTLTSHPSAANISISGQKTDDEKDPIELSQLNNGLQSVSLTSAQPQLEVTVVNMLPGAQLKFLSAYPLEAGADLLNPILSCGEQTALVLIPEIEGDIDVSLQGVNLTGCMIFSVLMPGMKEYDSLCMIIGWDVPLDTSDAHLVDDEYERQSNQFQVALIHSAIQDLPTNDDQWETLLDALGNARCTSNYHELSTFQVDNTQMAISATLEKDMASTLTVKLIATTNLSTSSINNVEPPMDLNTLLSYASMSQQLSDDMPYDTQSTMPVLGIRLCNHHPDIFLQQVAAFPVTGQMDIAFPDVIFPKSEAYSQIIATNDPIACTGLALFLICDPSQKPLPFRPYLAISWDVDAGMGERSFFSRVIEDPFHGEDVQTALPAGDWVAAASLFQQISQGRMYEAGQRVTTRCALAGEYDDQPADQLMVQAFMPMSGALQLYVDFSQIA